MKKSKAFYDQLKAYTTLFREHNLARKSQGNYRRSDGFRVQFVLDRWGWDHQRGSGFFVRFIDERCEDGVTVFDARGLKELTPQTIMNQHMLSSTAMDEIYKEVPNLVRSTFDEGSWFSYYDPENLQKLLDALIPRILPYFNEWAEERKSTDDISSSGASTEDKAKALAEFDELFKDFRVE